MNTSSPSYLRGVHDGQHVGRYDQRHHDALRETDPIAASEYKAGYDRGVAIFCETLDAENEA